ncbi:FAD-dependent oxidoreductase, partial [Novipirellula maiorica]|uniref:FAD-dependent oxidoreductase n=1 Tax=Novipirellula maiorica TaxID=1265734 RepID=UPI000592E9F4
MIYFKRLFLALLGLFFVSGLDADELVLVETESLPEKGGWVVDQQFMDQMGSPYLLAHGLGEPVPDASGEVQFAEPGEYRVWVRTRDWVAPWKVPGAPGRFQLLIDGKPLKITFGIEGDPWHWQDGGKVSVGQSAAIALHDLTGFEGRCDAILFCKDTSFQPPDGGEELASLRSRLLGWDREPQDAGEFDLVVIGGGVAGTTCSVSAARQGLKVALIQDRPVLGGNGSSEVRVWPEGHINLKPFPHVGDIVGELIPPHPPGQAMAIDGKEYNDARKERIVRAEKNITLMLNHRAIMIDAKMPTDETDGHIHSVIAQHTETGRRVIVRGKFFVDSTGDGVIGALAGADNEVMERGNMGTTNPWSVGAVEHNEPQLKCLCKDLDPWSFDFKVTTDEQPFPRCPWAIDMTNLRFPGRKDYVGQWPGGQGPIANLGRWFWESGSGKHPIHDMEWVRDYNFRAMYGAWDTLKNVDNLHPNQRLKWAAY